jgi:polysaccharide deacetylase family protein (PEP-CTERM system associated)
MNILTFDLEDWFHILDHPQTSSPGSWQAMESRIEKNTDRILLLLDEKKIRATWFCLGWVAEKFPALVKKISLNHEIGCHSMDHRLLFNMTQEEVAADIRDNIHMLEDIAGKKIISYRAPGFSLTRDVKWAVPILAEAGIKFDASIFPTSRNHGGFSNFPVSTPCRVQYHGVVVKEFPMNIFSILGNEIVFSGGGYFRMMPYMAISSMMNKSSYVMTYFHPRDFDPAQPVLKTLSAKRKFMSYTGLKNSFTKLKRLVNDYKFIAMENAANQIDWNETPVINLEKY